MRHSTPTRSKSHAPSPSRLPIALTSFIGRESEIALIKDLLTTTRLVTLTGAGGSGKTRLALQVATQLAEGAVFQEGVCWVELQSLANPELVPQSIAGALRLPKVRQRSYLDIIADDLLSKQLLLVLDNCEHLINASAHIAHQLLTHCPHLKILATSRECLGIDAEHVFPVPLLSLPSAQAAITLDRLVQSDAIRLFLARAQAVKPEFSLTKENASVVTQVCRRLDGIPLALELAATRVRVLTAQQIATRLQDRFSLLTTGSRTALPRHQTLRATLDWSYDLLAKSEKILFRRLAVFSGGWTLEAAEAVCSGDGIEPGEVLDLLTRLIDKSLVTVQENIGIARYHFLDTIQAHAYEKLQASGDLERLQERHLDFFLRLVEATHIQKFGAPYISSIERYSIEDNNFRAALAWSLDGANIEKGVHLAGTLVWFWDLRRAVSEGIEWLQKALTLSNEVSAPVRAYAHFAANWIAAALCKFEEAIAFGEQSVALYTDLGDKSHYADALGLLGRTLFYQGSLEHALPKLEESLTLFRELDNESGTAACLRILAGIRQIQGDYEGSVPLLEESLALGVKLQDERCISTALATLANVYRERRDFAQATLTYGQAMVIRWKNGDLEMLAWGFEFYAILATLQKQAERAARLWGAGYALRKAIGYERIPVNRNYEDYERDARSLLDAETFERMYVEGGATLLEEMVEYAMAVPMPAPADAKPNFGGLTIREREIARLVAEGKSNREIADQLVLSSRTVGNHIANILGKLGFHSRTQIARWALEPGLSKN